MDPKTILSTQHLFLRAFDLDDAPFVIELVNSPKWLEFIGDRNINNLTDAENYLKTGPLKSYEDVGFGFWLVALKENEQPIGLCGLIKRDYLDAPDIGFALLPQFIGKGYGQEAASATLTYAHNELALPEIFAITDKKNIASIKLLTKLGLGFKQMIQSPQGENLLLFTSSCEPKDQVALNELTDRFFSVFNNEASRVPNLSLLKSLCIPSAQIIKNIHKPEIYTLNEFIEPRQNMLTDGTLTSFKEKELSYRTNVSKNVAQRFSLYLKTGQLHGTPFETVGIKSIQYIRIQDQWKIASIVWSDDD